jgi:hypothetical protein
MWPRRRNAVDGAARHTNDKENSTMRLVTEINHIDKRYRPRLDALRAEMLLLWNAPRFNADAFAHVCNEFDLIIGRPEHATDRILRRQRLSSDEFGPATDLFGLTARPALSVSR